MAKKANPPNLAKPEPNQDQFLLQPKISHPIFDASVTIPHQDCTKTITSLIHQYCYQGKKSQSIESRSFPFATKLFTHYFLGICDNAPPRLHKNHNFTYSLILLPRQKMPIHRIWLSKTQAKSIPFVTKLFTPHF